MNPAVGSEVRDIASRTAEDFAACLNRDGDAVMPPSLHGDVREAYVAAFCAELMAREGITMKRLRAALREGQS